ncbi:MAG: UDP-N-acetylglucosamine 2-epimerase (non-hydrolyzing) [Acidobacteria bacterium]|nr:UDP-N-acetylglucosamine 2-epimerase (non-hydrolyzing) [Acidobacteriota bacterium]
MGTRPEAIKLAPVLIEIQQQPGLESVLCSTGQHRELLDQVTSWFGLTPDIELNLMTPNQDAGLFAARAMVELSKAMHDVNPDIVVVQGDTTTAMIAALSASYRRIAVAHVEAGLRTGELNNPFPEEINRRLISAIARYHFAPTKRAADALLRENADPAAVFQTGNTVIDALRLTLSRLPETARRDPGQHVILVTTHRRESFGAGMRHSLLAMREIAERNPGVTVRFPVHLNPNVAGPAHEILGGHPRIELTHPMRYEQFVAAMASCDLILTDSGGIQEEAPFLGKPVVVMRTNTERPEAVEAGTAVLVGTDPARIVETTERLLHDPAEYQRMSRAGSPFGDGHAARRIVEVLAQFSAAGR